MGERLSDGGPPGRRRAHPDGTTPSGSRGTGGEAALEALLAAAVRGRGVDAEGERRAVAAYRAARAAGAHRARTRRRDDWRPREQRRAPRSLRATLSLFLASLTLGGVTVAAIGTTGSSSSDSADGPATPTPSASAADRPGAEAPSDAPGTPAHTERPDTAQDTEAHCRAHERLDGRGNALEAAAWRRLVEAAGGERKVDAYCAEQLAQAAPTSRPSPSRTAVKPSPPAAEATKGADHAENGPANAENGRPDKATGNPRN
ncbi:hypothetical protein [Streptomyces sp. TRM68416]|uniref:hypothetical protein n=1 Tax=Streptomyces sp. TRM68416 TaxID=2758412 RepID=UPI001661A805|nr:hypothetical protein [Streptomyces sp. TRM68416]MBD0839282.1 hypothetical protein [Streptomyces sp. TRM68416]